MFTSSSLQPSDRTNKANYSNESSPTIKQLNALTSKGILNVLVNKKVNMIEYMFTYTTNKTGISNSQYVHDKKLTPQG